MWIFNLEEDNKTLKNHKNPLLPLFFCAAFGIFVEKCFIYRDCDIFLTDLD